jgi:hypothetical protein
MSIHFLSKIPICPSVPGKSMGSGVRKAPSPGILKPVKKIKKNNPAYAVNKRNKISELL